MKFVSVATRWFLIIGGSILGGALAMLAYYDFDPSPLPARMWVFFALGMVLANFIARWWSHKHPPYLTSEWFAQRREREAVATNEDLGTEPQV